jgi:hypothetical protein
MSEWMALTNYYKGWTITEIRGLTYKERFNWLEVAKAAQGLSSKE